MEFPELFDALNNASDAHHGTSSMLYFGEGPESGVQACKRVLFLLKESSAFSIFTKDSALIYHPIFPLIKNHVDQIRQNYHNCEERLLFLLIRRLIPFKLNPLKNKVLSRMSLFSAPVQLNNKKFKPAPITGFIDGYYNFVIPVGGNVIRIPLIPKDGSTPVTLPPSITFIGNEKERENAQNFLINKAVKIGRIYQFNAFISVMGRSDPRLGVERQFKDALTSFDLSFATALAAISYDDAAKGYLMSLINVLGCNRALDHFIRTLATCSRLVISSVESDDSIQFTALTNIFACSPFEWATVFDTKTDITLSDIINIVCCEHLRSLPPISLYALRSALVVACYQDPTGDKAIEMFLELAIRPFVKKFYLEASYLDAKEKMVKKDEEVESLREIVKKSILTVLGMDINIDLTPSKVEEQMNDLYDFALSRVGDLVNLVIVLNTYTKEKNPVLQTLMFGYQISLDNDVESE